MDEQTYLKNRVEEQFNYLDKSASLNQWRYKALRSLSLVASVLIPLLSGFLEKGGLVLTIVIGGLGALVAIAQGLLSLNRYHENWTQYRVTAEALKRERLLYENRSSYYGQAAEPYRLFVENIETLLSGENTKWLETRLLAEKEGTGG